jgi:HD superfamily phosphodiesterase
MDEQTLRAWEERIASQVRQNGAADVAHDLSHVERVVRNARRIGSRERADLAVVVPAAWLHDIWDDSHQPKIFPQGGGVRSVGVDQQI